MSLKEIHTKLVVAADLLDHAASEISGSPLKPSERYVREIGEALRHILEVKNAIYALDASLTPELMKQPSPFPAGESRRFGEVLIRASDIAANGDIAGAISQWVAYLESEPHEFFRDSAKRHIEHLERQR